MAEELIKVSPMVIAEKTSAPAPMPIVTPSKSVLVVEDDVFLSGLLVSRLEQAGLSVQKAMTGEEALKILRSGTIPSLILLDIGLSVRDALKKLLETANKRKFKLKEIIVCSRLGTSGAVIKYGEIEKLMKNAGFSILELNTFTRSGGSTTWIQVIAQKA